MKTVEQMRQMLKCRSLIIYEVLLTEKCRAKKGEKSQCPFGVREFNVSNPTQKYCLGRVELAGLGGVKRDKRAKKLIGLPD